MPYRIVKNPQRTPISECDVYTKLKFIHNELSRIEILISIEYNVRERWLCNKGLRSQLFYDLHEQTEEMPSYLSSPSM